MTLVGLGGMLEGYHMHAAGSEVTLWIVLFVVGAIGWSWAFVFCAAAAVRNRVLENLGVRKREPRTDAAALADELRSLRAQVAEMRETASSFDLSFDQALDRLDRRVKCVEEQQPRQIQVGRG